MSPKEQKETEPQPGPVITDPFKELRKPFPPERIGKLDKSYERAGRRVEVILDYVSHADVTDRLLECDPTWTWEPVSYDSNGQPVVDQGHSDVLGLWIRLTVCGVTRLGYGTARRDARDPIKELIGDAIRNAAMRFGVALQCWMREDTAPAAPGEGAYRNANASPPPVQNRPATQPARQAANAPSQPKPQPPPSKDMVEVLGVMVHPFDWEAIRTQQVGGQGKKRDLTWEELATPIGDHERYLDWCLENTKKDLAAGKPVSQWMSKAIIAYAQMRQTLSTQKDSGAIDPNDTPF